MPRLTRPDVEQAFKYFDDTHRDTFGFMGWEKNPDYSLIIEANEKRYPFIVVYGHVAGKPTSQIDENEGINELSALGFTIKRLQVQPPPKGASQTKSKLQQFQPSPSSPAGGNLLKNLLTLGDAFGALSKAGKVTADGKVEAAAGSIIKILQGAGHFTEGEVTLALVIGEGGKWKKAPAITLVGSGGDFSESALNISFSSFPKARVATLSLELDFAEALGVLGAKGAVETLSQTASQIRLLCQEVAAERSFNLSPLDNDVISSNEAELQRVATVAHKRYSFSEKIEEKEFLADFALLLGLMKDYAQMTAEARAAGAAKKAKAAKTTEAKVITDAKDLFEETKKAGDYGQLADSLFIPTVWVERLVDIIDIYGQFLVLGPPATSKTFTARGLALALAQDIGRVFFAPVSPGAEGGALLERVDRDGEMVDGPLKKVARKAAADPNNTYVLVIDDIHFTGIEGLREVFYLIRNRNEFLTLSLSGDDIAIPENMKVIATATCSDGICEGIEKEWMRVFPIVRFSPSMPPVRGMLSRFVEAKFPNLDFITKMVDEVNSTLSPNSQVGPAYFMRDDLDEKMARVIWDHMVIPRVLMVSGDDAGRIKGVEFETLRHKVVAAGKRS